jgi:Flp pilus assembly protein TadG
MLRRSVGNEKGQALVELTLVIPVLLFVIFGGIELARGINYWLDANHVANEAARWASVNRIPGCASPCSLTVAQLQTFANGELDSAAFPQTNASQGTTRGFTVCLPAGTTAPHPQVGDPVKITVTLTWPLPLVSSLSRFFGFSGGATSVPIAGSSQMRVEQAPTFTAGAVTSC